MHKAIQILSIFLIILALNYPSHADNQPDKIQPVSAGFIHRKGSELVRGKSDTPILLKGVCLGNDVWNNENIPTADHGALDYQRIRNLNMNVVRFYLNYSFFYEGEDKKQTSQAGWDWLDENIEMARQNGIYLILNMHVPPGGFQSNGDGLDLWEKKENQVKFKELWKSIARRYKNEESIAGYDILNEPVTSKSMEQWQKLAQETVDTIREEDKNHLLIIERLNGIAGKWNSYCNLNLFLVKDPNTMYTFHYYYPYEYTHQNTPWTALGDGGPYPNNERFETPWDTTWVTSNVNTRKLPEGNSDWTFYTGEKAQITDPEIISGKPLLVSCFNSGNAYFDDIEIQEFDEKGIFVRNIFKININPAEPWQLWSADQSGDAGVDTSTGHGDSGSIMIYDTTGLANCYNKRFQFPVKTNYYYSINGWMKGEGINKQAYCKLSIGFDKSPGNHPLLPRNKLYLQSELVRFLEFGKTNDVPLYVGEWGLYKDCFEPGKGGAQWVSDMLDLFNHYNVHSTYHDYHEPSFGLYRNAEGLPDETQSNKKLIDLFKQNK